ncbi:bactofilin family protein, partial [Leptospira interrogans]
ASCRMKGDIVSPRIVMEEGVQFEGNCKINPVAH